MIKLPDSYKDLFGLLGHYWSIYGGLSAVIKSPFLHLSCVLTLFMGELWNSSLWMAEAMDVIPDMLGFALGGYAILVVFGDDRFLKIIAGTGTADKASAFMGINAAFLHFILIQLVVLLLAMIVKHNPVGMIPLDWKITIYNAAPTLKSAVLYAKKGVHFFGTLLYIYAVTLAFAAALAIFRVSRWFDLYQQKRKGVDVQK